MSVYVGIDVHRKRSQVAVVDQGDGVLANRRVPNGVEPVGVHVSSILRKLDATTRVQAATVAERTGLLAAEPIPQATS